MKKLQTPPPSPPLEGRGERAGRCCLFIKWADDMKKLQTPPPTPPLEGRGDAQGVVVCSLNGLMV